MLLSVYLMSKNILLVGESIVSFLSIKGCKENQHIHVRNSNFVKDKWTADYIIEQNIVVQNINLCPFQTGLFGLKMFGII